MTILRLQQRAHLLAQVRDFFKERNVLEVETPMLAASCHPDLHIQHLHTQCCQQTLYLQSSPELHMKRLLAEGSGPIYQISKVFRDQEMGQQHNPEFSLLEWYRPGFNHHQLMDEMDELLAFILHAPKASRSSYADIFQQHLDIDPHQTDVTELQHCAKQCNINVQHVSDQIDDWLDLLMSHIIAPKLGVQKPCYIHSYPASQAIMSKIEMGLPKVAARFEVYVNGLELANGFHELTDAKEQRKRFQYELIKRKQRGLTTVPLDEDFLDALVQMPDCAGVALGVDRLLMLQTNQNDIQDILSFR